MTEYCRTGGGFKRDKDAPVKRQDKGNKKDNSKVVKKHISLDKLRAETKKNESHDDKKGGKRFGRFRNKKHGKPGKKSGPKLDDEQMK